VDDEPTIRSALFRAFRGLDQVKPLFASDGEAALDVLKRFPVDVIVTDQSMPGMTGNKLLTTCRRLYPHMARVLLTAFADRETVSFAATYGAVDFVFRKPWDDVELKACIIAAMEKAGIRRRAANLKAWLGGATEGLHHSAEELMAQFELTNPIASRHCWRTAELTRLFGDDLGLDAGDLYMAALLHDVGKSTDTSEIRSAGDRTFEEQKSGGTGDQHPLSGESMVLRLQAGTRIASWIRHHHEHFDGSGYPDGLRGAAIPLGARALRIVDAYDNMTISGMKAEDIRQAMLQDGNAEFDPRLAKRFVTKLEELSAAR
jgi:response regulator RpfG family c-di-GMP phosphodiesterase